MRVFVAGAGGFIGGAVAGLLERTGHEVLRHERLRDGDLAMGSVPAGVDAVVNSSGRLGGGGADARDLEAGNVGTAEVLGRDSARLGIPLVHLSTPGVTGLVAGAVEEMPPAPWGPYEAAKARAEEVLASLLPSGRLTILRPDFVYGPGDMHKAPLFRQASRGWFPMVGSGRARLRPTYVADAARAAVEGLPGGCLEGGLYNIGGPEVVTVSGMVSAIGLALGRKVLAIPVPRIVFAAALRLGLGPGSLSESRYRLFGSDHFVDTARAAAAGFTPRSSLGEGLRATVDWLRGEGMVGR